MKLSQVVMISLCMISLFLSNSYAQSKPKKNSESTKSSTKSHTPEFTGQLGIDFNEATGNFEQFNLNTRGSIYKRWKNKASLQNSFTYRYMKSGELIFSDDFRDFAIANLSPLSEFSVMFLGLYHQSYTRYIDWRWMTGSGVAWSPVRSKSNQFRLSLAGAYEWTTLDNRPPPFTMIPPSPANRCLYRTQSTLMSCNRQMWRFIPRIAGHHEILEHRLIFNYEALWVVDPANREDDRIFLALTINAPIYKWLSVYAHYDWSYESMILNHREYIDTRLSLGLKVNFKDSHLGY